MRLMVDWLRPVLTASMRLDQCVAPFGVFSSVSRTTCSIFSSPISRGAPGRGSSPSPATPSAIKRLRQMKNCKSCRAQLRCYRRVACSTRTL